jgi:two-component system response regulator AtoC
MKTQKCVLVIDDDAQIQASLPAILSPPYAVYLASTGEDGLDQYDRVRPDVVMLDVMLPQMGGLAVLRALKRRRPDQPVIMMTAYAEIESAVQAIKLGALDYLQKPLDSEAVLREINRVTTTAAVRPDPARAGVIGESPALRRAWKLVERFGPTDIPILLQGETGTGKGLIAQALHRVSKRADNAFVAIDCATIPDQLAESELFGYEDGAFTGAAKRKRGRVAFADRGTLFLDEIGTLSLATQSKLLTLIEQRDFLPLGARNLQPTHIDVRFISATNVPLHRAVDEGTFRADLFHRLDGVTIELPPLRERERDIELLARQFVATLGREQGKPEMEITPDAVDVLRGYAWPGNVRELQRVLAAAVVLADTTVDVDDLPQRVRTGKRVAQPAPPAEAEPVSSSSPAAPTALPLNLREIKEWAGREAQKRVIEELQKHTNISRQELARMLGVDPKTLRSRLKEMSTSGH